MVISSSICSKSMLPVDSTKSWLEVESWMRNASSAVGPWIEPPAFSTRLPKVLMVLPSVSPVIAPSLVMRTSSPAFT
ncbi:hypothetical protein D3C83_27760 [compost metagenome]